MRTGFSRHQLKKLATGLDPTRVQTRQQDGKALSYIEGWFVIAEANRIFGYDGWDREMVHFERVFERKAGEGISCGYVARVRIRVRASATTIVREGTGFGQASATRAGDAHERALKAAETDATKRALATFGSRFGLMLYGKEQRPAAASGTLRSQATGSGQSTETKNSSAEASKSATANDAEAVGAAGARDVRSRSAAATTAIATESNGVAQTSEADATGQPRRHYRLIASDGSVIELHSPESFCSSLRQLLDAARDQDEVQRLQHNNADTITALRALSDLTTQRGEHFADILERLIAQRNANLAADSRSAPNMLAGSSIETHDAHTADIGDANAVEVATTSATVPGDPADDAPSGAARLYAPFVPVPDYPLGSLKERVVRRGRAARSKPPVVQIRRGVSQDDGAVRLRTEPAPTRRSQITGGFSIDKSALLLPSERRLRSKAHLQFVASKPCLVCEAQPCHAHHITFAQARGLSQKVSDEFTVPLCIIHHNELHVFGNEASWWRAQGIEPLAKASELWRETAIGSS